MTLFRSESEEFRRTQLALREWRLKFLYVAPERLARPETASLLARSNVKLLAIDEAHCISQWGHDFRPEYLLLGKLGMEIGCGQTIALTATADAPTRADLAEKLFAAAPRIFLRSFDRPHLRLALLPKRSEERRVGKGGVSTCKTRWAPVH